MKTYHFLIVACLQVMPLVLLGLNQKEKDEDIRRDKKEIEQKEWEQSQYDWHKEKDAEERKFQEYLRERERVQSAKREQQRVEARQLERKIEDRRRNR